MLYILISIAFVIIAGIFNSEMDEIKDHPDKVWFQSDWWLGLGEHSWDKRTKLTKGILSFLSNGWHFCKSAMVLCFIIALTVSWIPTIIFIGWWIIPLTIISLYILFGTVFEIFYEN